MRFDPPSIAFRGQLARAIAQVHQQGKPDRDVSGRISCPKCGAALHFTVQSTGLSRGHCAAACGIRWCQ